MARRPSWRPGPASTAAADCSPCRRTWATTDRTKLAWVRDTSLNVRYRITDNVQLRLGYEFFWVSSVLRPGQQIDLGVNPTLLPFNPGPVSGPIRPLYRPDGETFWMHGINVGVAVQF